METRSKKRRRLCYVNNKFHWEMPLIINYLDGNSIFQIFPLLCKNSHFQFNKLIINNKFLPNHLNIRVFGNTNQKQIPNFVRSKVIKLTLVNLFINDYVYLEDFTKLEFLRFKNCFFKANQLTIYVHKKLQCMITDNCNACHTDINIIIEIW